MCKWNVPETKGLILYNSTYMKYLEQQIQSDKSNQRMEIKGKWKGIKFLLGMLTMF